MSDQAKQKVVKGGEKRVPLRTQRYSVLDVDLALLKPGFKPMWVNELPGAIEAHQRAGWELVIDPTFKITPNDGQIQFESRMDSVVRQRVNVNRDAPFTHAVLMQIPLEFYQADHEAEQAEVDEKELAFNSPIRNIYGDIAITNSHFKGNRK